METEKQTKRLGKAVLGIMAVGLTAGIALIAATKKVGDRYFLDDEPKKEADAADAGEEAEDAEE